MSGKGSKNNLANRGAAAVAKKVKGKEVRPVRYQKAGGRRYMAAAFENGELVLDALGSPVPYQSI